MTQSQPLRVAVVASSLKLAGAEKQTFYQARALHHAGVALQFYHLGGDGHYEPALQQAGVNVERIYYPNGPGRILAKLITSIWSQRPHVVLAAQFDDLRYAAPAGRLCRSLVLGGVRSDGFYELKQYGHWLPRLAHGLIANSFRAKQNLMSVKIHGEKIEVLPNVIDLADFDESRTRPCEFSLPQDRTLVVVVGNLHAYKRFDRFLEALALARRTEPKLAGVIAGADCGVRPALQAHAEKLGLMARDLIFLGAIDCVPALLARSAMLALTSDYEGFPNVILEAMAARLPVITVPAGDAKVVVRHEQTGFVVAADDIRDLAARMVQLAQFPELRQRFGEAGRRCVEKDYGCGPLAERLLDIFHVFACQHRKFSLCVALERTANANSSEPVTDGPVFAPGQVLNNTALPARKPLASQS